MDSLMVFTLFLSCGFILHTVSAGCAEDLQHDQAFKTCNSSITKFMETAMSPSGSGGNPVAALCSDNGKKTVGCLRSFIESCPELGGLMQMATVFKEISQPGGLDAMCSLISGYGDSSCAHVQACISNLAGEDMTPGYNEGDAGRPWSELNDYRYLQWNLRQLCGQIKRQLACIELEEVRCAVIVDTIKRMIETEQKHSWNEYKKFVKEDCPMVPADFFTNSCVKTNLQHEKFLDCFNNTATNDKCRKYQARVKCVRDAIKSCGKENFQTFVKATPMMIKDFPMNCPPDELVGSSTMNVPVTSFVFGLVFFLFLRYFIDF